MSAKALGRAPVYVIDLFKGCHIYYGVTIGIVPVVKSVLRTVLFQRLYSIVLKLVTAILRLFGDIVQTGRANEFREGRTDERKAYFVLSRKRLINT